MNNDKLNKAIRQLTDVTKEQKQLIFKLKQDLEWSEKHRGIESIDYKRKLFYHAQSLGYANAVSFFAEQTLSRISELELESKSYFMSYHVPDVGYVELGKQRDYPPHLMKVAEELDRIDNQFRLWVEAYNSLMKRKSEVILSVYDKDSDKGIPADWPERMQEQRSKSIEWYKTLMEGLV